MENKHINFGYKEFSSFNWEHQFTKSVDGIKNKFNDSMMVDL